MKFSLEDIAGIIGARIEGAPSAPTIDTLITDSRKAVDPSRGQLFIAYAPTAETVIVTSKTCTAAAYAHSSYRKSHR